MSSQLARHRADVTRLRRVGGWPRRPAAAGCATAARSRPRRRRTRAGLRPRRRRVHQGGSRQPRRRDARLALDRAKLRASQDHDFRAQRLAAADRYEEALVEYQLAAELNPTDANVEAALRDRARSCARRSRSRATGRPSSSRSSSDRAISRRPGSTCRPRQASRLARLQQRQQPRCLHRIAQFAGLNVVFDPAFATQTINVDLRKMTLVDALTSVTASTHTFYRVSAPAHDHHHPRHARQAPGI